MLLRMENTQAVVAWMGNQELLYGGILEVDQVVACMVRHHLSNPVDTIREAHRALRPGGRLVVVDLHRHEDEALRESMADLWLGFPPADVRDWLETSQFTIMGAEVVGEPDSLKLITFQGQKK